MKRNRVSVGPGIPFRPTQAFYSPKEVAALAGVHPSTIRGYIKTERLYAVRVSPRKYRIPARSVQLLLDPDSVPRPRVDIREVARIDFRDADREPEFDGAARQRADRTRASAATGFTGLLRDVLTSTPARFTVDFWHDPRAAIRRYSKRRTCTGACSVVKSSENA